MIRHATAADASRIAEILIFSKRKNYRAIFRNDKVSFGEMLVYPLAKSFVDEPERLENIWVYDDEFVKGMIRLDGKRIAELYVDPFFENQGIGTILIKYAVDTQDCDYLWVLEKNTKAAQFYQRHGFEMTEEKQKETGTNEYIVKMKRERPSL